jgi:hypothetical protein
VGFSTEKTITTTHLSCSGVDLKVLFADFKYILQQKPKNMYQNSEKNSEEIGIFHQIFTLS